jgi:DTW domain-containing protein YfiP
MLADPAPTRPSCDRCLRPLSVCFCPHLPVLPTRTRVLLLQHPREQHMAIGTARMAHLALPNSTLIVGTDFANDPVVARAMADDATYVLFPGAQAVDVATLPRDRPITLIVVDGTWWQARKLLKLNPALAAQPRVAFTPTRPSQYLIRRQPAEFCVSTIEALAEVLAVLEPQEQSFTRLLDPFHAMVAKQRWYQTQVRSQRHRLLAERPRRRPTLGMRLRADWSRLICVQGEANAWPRRDPARADPETIHWLAGRPATGETFEAVVAPRRALAPSTPAYAQLPADRLLAGSSVADWHRSWSAFARPDDVIVLWGTFYRDLAVREGLPLGPVCIDLRGEMSQWLRGRVGTIEECLRRMSIQPSPAPLGGRAGRRLAGLTAIVQSVCA